jgi:hypothetical protein
MTDFPDDVEYSDTACVKCGHTPTHTRICTQIGCNDGQVDAYEDDPVNAAPGEFFDCEQCLGTGEEHWCPNCGADLVKAEPQ